jgi:hypothetical protein
MPSTKSPVGQLCQAIENLSPAEFSELNQMLDQKRRSRLRKIAQKARQSASGTSPEESERILQEAIAAVRTENATHGRP